MNLSLPQPLPFSPSTDQPLALPAPIPVDNADAPELPSAAANNPPLADEETTVEPSVSSAPQVPADVPPSGTVAVTIKVPSEHIPALERFRTWGFESRHALGVYLLSNYETLLDAYNDRDKRNTVDSEITDYVARLQNDNSALTGKVKLLSDELYKEQALNRHLQAEINERQAQSLGTPAAPTQDAETRRLCALLDDARAETVKMTDQRNQLQAMLAIMPVAVGQLCEAAAGDSWYTAEHYNQQFNEILDELTKDVQ